MKLHFTHHLWIIMLISCSQQPENKKEEAPDASPGYEIACYYFPNYHLNDSRNASQKGPGWSEWELVKDAKPRFEGHQQPNIPAWGYTNESDPEVMEMKISTAAEYGIDAFIFDWYYYDDGPFLEKCLDDGFLNASNKDRMKFGLMWANHDWVDIHPCTKEARIEGPEILYPGKVTLETWEKIVDMLISKYFRDPAYWKIDGNPYFSIYDITRFIEIFGSKQAAIEGIKDFREKVISSGLPGLNLNAVVWGKTILPSEEVVDDVNSLVKELGFNSITSYVWIHHFRRTSFPTIPYEEAKAAYLEYAEEAYREFDLPYYPNVTMGWDSSPRAHQDDPFENVGYPFMSVLEGNTPQAFKKSLEDVKSLVDQNPSSAKTFNINCWNEWTEGSYLEPDLRNGYAYLEAIREVFGENQR